MLMRNNYVGFDIAMEKITIAMFNVLINKYITWIKLLCFPAKILSVYIDGFV